MPAPDDVKAREKFEELISPLAKDPEALLGLLNLIRAEFDAGDRGALLMAVWICAYLKRALPDWAAEAFCLAYQGVRHGNAKSWDDAFGPPFDKGHHLTRERISNNKIALHARVRELVEGGENRDNDLFAKVGKEFNVGTTKAKEMYYEWEHIEGPLRKAGIISLPPNSEN